MSNSVEIKTDKDYLVFCNDMLEKYNNYKKNAENDAKLILTLRKKILKLEKKLKKAKKRNLGSEIRENQLDERDKLLNIKNKLLDEMSDLLQKIQSKLDDKNISINRIRLNNKGTLKKYKTIRELSLSNRMIRLKNYRIKNRIKDICNILGNLH